MNQFFIWVGIALLLMMIPIFYRVGKGPGIIDRILGANMIGAKTMIILVLIGTIFNRVEMFVDLALTYALLNFIGSIAAAKYFRRYKRVRLEPIEVTEEAQS